MEGKWPNAALGYDFVEAVEEEKMTKLEVYKQFVNAHIRVVFADGRVHLVWASFDDKFRNTIGRCGQ